MLYRVLHEFGAENLAVVGVRPEVIKTPGAFVTNGNAANDSTEILPGAAGLKQVLRDWSTLQSDGWNQLDGS